MERYGRIAVPGAVIGLVLSVLVGLIAGVGLGTVILRGVISAVAMGAGSAGLYAAAERLLPGLTEEGVAGGNGVRDDDGTNDETEIPEPGGQLNIVVEDESDESDGVAEADSIAETGDDRWDAEDEGAPEAPPVEAEPLDAEPVDAEPLDAEPADAEPADAEPLDAPPAEERPAEPQRTEPQRTEAQNAPPSGGGDIEDDEIDDDLVEEIEEQSADDAEAIMNQAIAEEKYGSGVEIDDSVLDEMPDIGSFSGSFGSDAGSDDAENDGDGTSAGPSGGSGRQNGKGTAGNDPAQIAKALKTMLSRDGKE
ncbi:MAG: hypothetical protein PF508_13875 [Spirochaeta sp.]|jgi:hypothetical protein|nr:hypothetical protein [Spirochaeta sp.]